MPYTPNNPLVPGDPYSYDLKWMVQKIKEWQDPLDSAERAEAAAAAADISKEAAIDAAERAEAAAASVILPFTSPEEYGAVGDGVTDDKAAFQAAINSGKAIICRKDAVYAISVDSNGIKGITCGNNTIIDLNGSTIQVLNPENLSTYYIVSIDNCTNVLVQNGTILGERSTHSGTAGEHGHGISLGTSKDVVLENLTIKDCWGDGIYVGGVSDPSEDVIIDKIICDNNRRNGLSIVNCKNAKITNSEFNNTNGVNPQFGIDCESNSASDYLEGIIINNCSFKDNAVGSIEIFAHKPGSNFIINNIFANKYNYFSLRDSEMTLVVDNCFMDINYDTPIFDIGCSGTSIIDLKAKAKITNTVGSCMRMAASQPHRNIKADIELTGTGSVNRYVLSYSPDNYNCNFRFKLNNVPINDTIYAVPLVGDFSNYGFIDDNMNITGTRFNGAVKQIHIDSTNPNNSIILDWACQSESEHIIVNNKSTAVTITGSTFINALNGNVGNPSIPAGRTLVGRFIAGFGYRYIVV